MAGSEVFRLSYSQTLRVIGQFLESVKPTEFDLQFHGNEIALRYKAVETVQEPAAKSRFSFLSGTPQVKTQKIDSSREYSSEDISAADREAQSRRTDAEGNADFYSLSQTLRTLGTYVEHRNLRLLAINWNGSTLRLELVTTDGVRKVEEHPVSSFHDYFLRMSLRRKSRGGTSFV
ncbi:MAG TPA: hypothetical protein VIB79_24160 [Candidatus Binatia bacterium]|jgi:hypothetical protein